MINVGSKRCGKSDAPWTQVDVFNCEKKNWLSIYKILTTKESLLWRNNVFPFCPKNLMWTFAHLTLIF